MSILKKLFGKEESTDETKAVVDSQVEVKAEVKKKEQKPEVVSGDEPLVGK